jgi:RsiW-degrading membrane proteinase PrsW (M82 family)
LILYLTLGLCALAAAFIVCRHDLYDREPLPLLFITVVMGFAAMWLAGLVEAQAFHILGVREAGSIAVIAALSEELLKVLVVVCLPICARRYFNDPIDGLVYGSMAGLGMAVEESIHYMRELPQGSLFLPPAELIRVSGHLVMGGIGGFAIALAVLRRRHWPAILAACFAFAVALHFGWDWLVLSMEAAPATPSTAWWGAGLMGSGMVAYGVLAAIGSEQSRELFMPRSPGSFWGWPFNLIFRRQK